MQLATLQMLTFEYAIDNDAAGAVTWYAILSASGMFGARNAPRSTFAKAAATLRDRIAEFHVHSRPGYKLEYQPAQRPHASGMILTHHKILLLQFFPPQGCSCLCGRTGQQLARKGLD